MKTKTFSYSKFLLTVLVLILSAFLLVSPTGIANAQSVEEYDFSESANQKFSVKVQATDRDGSVTNGSSVFYNEMQGWRFDWQRIRYFRVTYSQGTTVPTPDDEGNYTYSISVQYLNAYISDNADFDHASVQSKVLVADEVTKDLSTISYDFSVELTDPDTLTGPNIDHNKWLGWGIYRFVIDISGTGESYSDYYGLEPTVITQAPTIDYEVTPSDNDLTNAYNFFLTGNENINYIDESTIKWYVRGEASDGTLYVLTEEDIGLWEGYNTAMFDALESRTGKNFHFDSKTGGKWEVFCELTPHNSTPNPMRSNQIEVTTGRNINPTSIVWFLVGGGVVLLGIIIFIIVYTKKKEKVW